MAITKKANKIARTVVTSKRADEKYIGQEIVVFDNIDLEIALKQNLKHYNYFYTRKDANVWISKWVKKNLSDKAYREFSAAETWRSCLTIGTVCKMHTNGAKFDEARMKWLNDKIENEILSYGRENKKQSRANSVSKTNPAAIVKARSEQIISDLEAVIDSWKELKGTFSLYSDLKNNEVPAVCAKAVLEYYSPLSKELNEAIAKKTDEQLKEAYSHFKTTELKEYAKFIAAIVTDAETYLNGKKATRQPRKKKVKSAGQLVSKVKYKKEDTELKLTSALPEKLVGAQIAYLFNTRYNTLSYLVSSSKTGFTISGTTVQNVDLEQSFKKTIRKASENIGEFVKAPKVRTLKLLEELKTAKSSTTGRINEDTLIVKIY
jgi:hypothetical protein